MRNLIASIVLLLFTTSCGNLAPKNTPIYLLGLSSVETPKISKVTFGSNQIVKISDTGKKGVKADKYTFTDSIIKIQFIVNYNSIDFKLKNLSTYPIKIIWDEACYVDLEGLADKV